MNAKYSKVHCSSETIIVFGEITKQYWVTHVEQQTYPWNFTSLQSQASFAFSQDHQILSCQKIPSAYRPSPQSYHTPPERERDGQRKQG